jgi:hypothetical protein
MLAIQEFNQQAANEMTLGLPVTPHMVTLDHSSKCKGEAGFAKFVARPYFEALLNCFPQAEQRALQVIDSNIEMWNAQACTNQR